MLTTNVTNFRQNIFEILEQSIKYNQPVHVTTKSGNAVVLSEDDYNGLMETLSIYAQPDLKEKIVEGLRTPVEECIPEDEVQW